MQFTIWVLLLVAATLLLVPILLLALEVAAASGLRRSNAARDDGEPEITSKVAVLIPAHDEGEGILPTIASVRQQLPSHGRLLVVADNCTDNTAAIARAAGADVIERHDPARRGKGYALDFGVRHLRAAAPDILVIIDADCRLALGALGRIVRLCTTSGRPVQAQYAMTAPPHPSPAQRIAEFAWRVNTHVRPLGLSRLGWPCQLAGTGMAFPWSVLSAADLATDHLVEDLKLGLDLAKQGAAPLFCPTARVESQFPTSEQGTLSQRQRWEVGALQLLLRQAPRHLWTALGTRNPQLFVLALDAAIPPLVMLAGLILAVVVPSAGLAMLSQGWAPLLVSTTAALTLGATLTLAYWQVGRDVLRPADLPALVAYVLHKVRLHRRQSAALTWVRTDRSSVS